MKKCGIAQSEFGKILGFSASGVSDIESDRRNVTERHIIMLSHWDAHHVNLDWLRTDKDEMFSPEPTSILEEAIAQFDLNEFEVAFTKVYLKLSKQQRDAFCNGMYDELIRSGQKEETPWERDARWLEEEAAAIRKRDQECSALPPAKDA